MKKYALTLVLAAVAMFGSVSSAPAATYGYCAGCTILANSPRISNVSKWASLSYTHRLSGPGAGTMTIGTFAFIANGPLICSSVQYALEVACNPGGNFVRGQSTNNGNGNYVFNAHLTY